jgi:hypothetical protein
MKYKIIAVFAILASILTFLAGVVSYIPYHFYDSVINHGVKSSYIQLPLLNKQFYSGNVISLRHRRSTDREFIDSLWKKFHFANYKLLLPIRNPFINFIPIVISSNPNPRLGAELLDRSKILQFSFLEQDNFAFKIKTDKHKIFSLPISKKYIIDIPIETIWRDIFTKKLDIEFDKNNLISSLEELYKIEYTELIYNLFILYMRTTLFNSETLLKLSFDERLNAGIAEYTSIDNRYKSEIVYFLRNGIVYGLSISTNEISDFAGDIRAMFLNNVELNIRNQDYATKIYAEYKTLPFHRRIDQEGMVYLFSAWGHTSDKKSFLKEMINFLERGDDNIKQLTPLYKYAYEKYGSSFSKRKDVFKNMESANDRLKRKIEEELALEIEKEEQKDANKVEEQGTNIFKSEKEKINYLLQKAKTEGVNTDLDRKSLER